MLFKHSLKAVCIVALIVMLTFISFGCSKAPSKFGKTENVIQGSLVDQICRNNRFVCPYGDWLIQKGALVKRNGITSSNSSFHGDDTIEGSKITFKNSNVTVNPVYTFSDNQLVSFYYLVMEPSEQIFLKECQAVKEQLATKLAAPFAGSLSILDQTPDASGSGSSIIWQGSDKSTLTVSTFNNTQTDPSRPYYILTIQTNSPGQGKN